MTASTSDAGVGPPTSHAYPATIERQLDHVEDRLVHDYAGRVAAALVRESILRALDELGEVRVEALIPVLVDRQARRHLDERLRNHRR